MEEREHYMGQIQQLQNEKDAALTRNSALIAFLRSEKAALESTLKSKEYLLQMKEAEIAQLRREQLEATSVITSRNAIISNLQRLLMEVRDTAIDRTSMTLSSNPVAETPQFFLADTQTTISTGEGQLQPELPPQDMSSPDVLAVIDPDLDMSGLFNTRLKGHAGPMDERERVEAGDEETPDIGCSTPQQPQSTIITKSLTQSPMEQIRIPEDLVMGTPEESEPELGCDPVLEPEPKDSDIWNLLETLVGSMFVDGKTSATIVCNTCRDTEWTLDMDEEELKKVLIKHAKEVHPAEFGNAISRLQSPGPRS
ncbi:hypothetical protein FRC04_010800 [Tulasnella sp. 424]|nr:hypothetical protein FRC04_010800 [Tulasnella sp. 424]KAG8972273.1 hypothetical protein FRC05_010216 [Tulasnella sp. 425]